MGNKKIIKKMNPAKDKPTSITSPQESVIHLYQTSTTLQFYEVQK